MAQIHDDIDKFSKMIVDGLNSENYELNYSLTSFKNIDSFISKHSKNGKPKRRGGLSKNLGPILFGLGAYVGITLIKLIPGTKWELDEKEPDNEVLLKLVFPDGGKIWPVQRIIKRLQNEEDGVYAYGYHFVKNYGDIDNVLESEKSTKVTINKKRRFF